MAAALGTQALSKSLWLTLNQLYTTENEVIWTFYGFLFVKGFSLRGSWVIKEFHIVQIWDILMWIQSLCSFHKVWWATLDNVTGHILSQEIEEWTFSLGCCMEFCLTHSAWQSLLWQKARCPPAVPGLHREKQSLEVSAAAPWACSAPLRGAAALVLPPTMLEHDGLQHCSAAFHHVCAAVTPCLRLHHPYKHWNVFL